MWNNQKQGIKEQNPYDTCLHTTAECETYKNRNIGVFS